MNILLIYKTEKESEKLVLSAINDLLLKCNHTVVSISEKDMKTVDHKQFSLVLIYNVLLTKKALKIIETSFIPKILIIEESKIFHSYIIQPTKYDKTLLLKDSIWHMTQHLQDV